MRPLLIAVLLHLASPAAADCEALLGGVGSLGSPAYIRLAKEPEGAVRRARETLERAAVECRDPRPYLLLATLRQACDERRHVLLETCSPTIDGRRLEGVGAVLDAGLARFPGDPRLLGLRLWLDARSLASLAAPPAAAPADLKRRLGATLAAALPEGRPLPEDAFLLVAAGRARLALGEGRAAVELGQALVLRHPDLVDGRQLLYDAQVAAGEEESAIAEVEKRAGRPPADRLDQANRPWERRQLDRPTDGARLLRQAADLAARRRMPTQAIHLYALSFLSPDGEPSLPALRRDAAFSTARRQLGRLLPASRKARLGLVVVSLRDDSRESLRRVAEALAGL